MGAPAVARKPRPASAARPKLRKLPPAARNLKTRPVPARKPKAPAMTVYRSKSWGVSASQGAAAIPLVAGRAAVAVRELPDSGAVVRMTRGRAWIAVLGALLAGIVALNVHQPRNDRVVGAGLGPGRRARARQLLAARRHRREALGDQGSGCRDHARSRGPGAGSGRLPQLQRLGSRSGGQGARRQAPPPPVRHSGLDFFECTSSSSTSSTVTSADEQHLEPNDLRTPVTLDTAAPASSPPPPSSSGGGGGVSAGL